MKTPVYSSVGWCVIIVAAVLGAISTLQSVTWEKTYYGGEGYSVQETSDSGYVVTGTWSLLETNEYGDSLWMQDYGVGLWIEQISDSGYIITGAPNLLRTNEGGDSIWAYDYEFGSKCVRQTSDNGYILTGTQGSGGRYLVLTKTNSIGDTLWFKTYEEPEHNINIGWFVEETMDSGFIVTGETGYWDEESGNSWAILWLLKTDRDGNVLWKKSYGEQNWNSPSAGYCVRQTTDNGFVISGEKSEAGFWLVKTDENGDTIWSRTYNGSYSKCVIETPEADYVAVGEGQPTNTWLTSLLYGGDVLLVKVDSYGNTEWIRNYGGDASDRGNCVAQASDGGYVICGKSESLVPAGTYLLKTDSLGFVDAIVEKPIVEVRNWGIISPIGPQTTLRYWDFPDGFYAKVFNVAGRKIDVIRTNASAGTLSWGVDFPSGVYFIQVIENQRTSSTKVVLVR
jgi:hypothetical protein